MCGIIGLINTNPSNQSAVSVNSCLIEGLKRLEYRGYDSAGVAVVTADHRLERRRSAGKLVNLVSLLQQQPMAPGRIGIGHTRWATHGAPTDTNAHPHGTAKVALVHNGIIENFQQLRQELSARGVTFTSQTDTEVIVQLLDQALQQGLQPLQALHQTMAQLEGAFAITMIFAEHPDLILGACRSSALVAGVTRYGHGFIASDWVSVEATQVNFINDNEIVAVTPEGLTIYNDKLEPVTRAPQSVSPQQSQISKDNYQHFMLKEIFEQPQIIADVLASYPEAEQIKLLPLELHTQRIKIIACGTSYYAGLVAKYWFEHWAGIETEVDLASEFRYRQPPRCPHSLYIFISQSGETADTLAAAEYFDSSYKTLALVNVAESSLTRKVRHTLLINAGPEIGVASTKAFTAQLLKLALLTLSWLDDNKARAALLQQLRFVPGLITQILNNTTPYQELARQRLQHASNIMYLGRQLMYPIALEGALKMKELSYIHAEAYAAGEMKHGPISLIDQELPVIVLAPFDRMFAKTASNIQEIKARSGQVMAITDNRGHKELGEAALVLPTVDEFVTPFIYTVAVQLLAYYTATALHNDVDQPRNLAKSVTVE